MKITCIGSGAFSIAIATILSETKENKIYIWSHDPKWVSTCKKKKLIQVADLKTPLKDNIILTSEYEEALSDTNMIFILVNSKYIQDVIKELKEFHLKKTPILIGVKGMLDAKPYFFSTYLKKALKTSKIAYFAGPNLAKDLVSLSPCIITCATKSNMLRKKLKNTLPDFIKLEFTKNFSVIELASILKNIYAIGAGILYEKYSYSSTLLSFVSLANKELAHILYDKYDFEDLELYSGIIGDFFLTNTMLESRNFIYGQKRAQNSNNAVKYLKETTVEGYNNIESVIKYLGENKYPILSAIFKIIYKNENTDTIFDICFRN